jgi:hypothetical protein
MGEPNAGQEVLVRLVRKLGSAEAAAVRLGIRPTLVERFVEGLVKVPDAILLKALDVITNTAPGDPVPALQPGSKPPKGRPVI